MQNHRLSILGALILVLFLSFPPSLKAQEACVGKQSSEETTPGCQPSSCRGQQTKFKEAKVISDLRNELVHLKSRLQQEKPSLKVSSGSNLIGETDEESLKLIFDEVQFLQDAVSENLNLNLGKLEYSLNAAKTVQKLRERIEELTKLL
nr:hypothetical protein [Allomuricauda sp.]